MIADLFRIHVPVLELVLRGTLVYWLLFCIFRFVLRRDVGAVGIADVLPLPAGTGCWIFFHFIPRPCGASRHRRA